VSAGSVRWWGWHQLDSRWARRIVDHAGINPGDLVLDVGAGAGALTAPLLAAGAHVIAFELHPGRAADLRRRFAGQPVRVVAADAADLRLPRRPFRVVANPPFAVSTALLRRLTSRHSRLVRADLVLPVPVAARWCRECPARIEMRLPATAFRPAPPHGAALLVVRP
jgi:23S rRNA (adenine-N6)-dimethyltransferase